MPFFGRGGGKGTPPYRNRVNKTTALHVLPEQSFIYVDVALIKYIRSASTSFCTCSHHCHTKIAKKILLLMFKLDRWINMMVFTFRKEFENHFKTPVWSFSSALGITSQSSIADHIDHNNLYYVSIFWTFLMICCFGFQCSVVSEVKVLILAIKESSVHRAI